MKTYKSNRNSNKWYEKINWLRLVILFLVIFVFFAGILNLLAQTRDMGNTIRVSLLIAALVGLESILVDLLEHRDRIYFVNKNKITYIEIHEDKDGKIFTHSTYNKILAETKPEDIHNHIEKHEGIDKGEVLEVLNVKRKSNKSIVKVKVKVKEWEAIGRFTISKMILNEREKEKKFIIMNDYEGYSELIEKLEKNML